MKKNISFQSDKVKRNGATYFGMIFAAGTLLISVIAFALVSKGWFSNNTSVSANGMSITAKQLASIKVYAQSNADEEALAYEDVNKVSISGSEYSRFCALSNLSDGNTTIYPGVSGTYKLFVELSDGGDNIKVNLKPYSAPGNLVKNEDDTTYSLIKGMREGYTIENSTAQVDYMKGHILFFTDCDEDGVYSGWLDPINGTDITLTNKVEGTNKYELTVYWVWVELYSDYSDSSFISTEDINRIKDELLNQTIESDETEANIWKYVLNRRTNNSEITEENFSGLATQFYNFADEDIAFAFQYIYFGMNLGLPNN